ncbi:hypothetical protein Hte_008268 [Hypoxylon texense]
MSHSSQIEKLRKIVSLITEASETVIAEWESNPGTVEAPEGVQLPSRSLFNAQRILFAAAGSIEELVGDPAMRLISLSSQFFESRALHIAAEHHVADILHGHDDAGVHAGVIAKKIGIDEQKLSRVLRCLTSQHVFRETSTDTFANNAVSKVLVGNEDLRAYVML